MENQTDESFSGCGVLCDLIENIPPKHYNNFTEMFIRINNAGYRHATNVKIHEKIDLRQLSLRC